MPSPRWAVLAPTLALALACGDPVPISGNGGRVLFTHSTFMHAEIDRLDVLVVLDDAEPLSRLQAAFDAVSKLVLEVATPTCVADGEPTGERARYDAHRGLECTTGSARFRPIADIHVGAVSARGSALCTFAAWLPDVERNLPFVLPRGGAVHEELPALLAGVPRLAVARGESCGLLTPSAALRGDLLRRDALLAAVLVGDARDAGPELEPLLAAHERRGDLPRARLAHDAPAATLEPWVRGVVERLQTTDCRTCGPPPVRKSSDGLAPCVVLETLARAGDTCTMHELAPPPRDVLEAHVERLRQDGVEPGPDQVCVVPQLATSPGSTCARDARRGCCFAEGAAGAHVVGACRQALVFTPSGTPLNRARVDVLCAEVDPG